MVAILVTVHARVATWINQVEILFAKNTHTLQEGVLTHKTKYIKKENINNMQMKPILIAVLASILNNGGQMVRKGR